MTYWHWGNLDNNFYGSLACSWKIQLVHPKFHLALFFFFSMYYPSQIMSATQLYKEIAIHLYPYIQAHNFRFPLPPKTAVYTVFLRWLLPQNQVDIWDFFFLEVLFLILCCSLNCSWLHFHLTSLGWVSTDW